MLLRCDGVLLIERILAFQSITFSSSSSVASPHSSLFTDMNAPQCLLILGSAHVTAWGYIPED